jgi:hypothetical protein
MSPEGDERLARAMASTMIEAEDFDFSQEIAKRDTLLALA